MRSLLFVLLSALLIAGCSLSGPDESTNTAPPRALTAAEKQVVESDNKFGLKLFRTISDEAAGENVFISPTSVSMALGMTLNGAEGETRAAMEEALEHAGLSEAEINESYRGLIDLLTTLDPEVTLSIANSIWHDQRFAVEPDFIDTNETYFDAQVEALDFADPGAVDTINNWVSDKTRGKIETILQSISPQEVMFLINALYFKGTWTYEFDEAETQDEAFTQHDGTTTQVPMMHQETDLPYFETEQFQAVDLPYGDSLYSMTVLLPRDGHDVDALAADLDQEQWADWTSRFETRAIDLKLPRFTMDYKQNLNDALTALGMGIAFNCGQADFTGINANGGLCISRVKHKTFLEVNEEGTEAAAVTLVGVDVTSIGGGPTAVHVNRPFVLAIREQHSGTLLFIGKVNAL